MTRSDNIWIVVADSAIARFFTPGKGRPQLIEVRPPMASEGTHGFSRDLKSDRPGRVFDAASSAGRHALEPRHDPHKVQKHKFAAELAAVLERECAAGAFEHLVLVAPRRTMGELRTLLTPNVAARLRQELQKDLTHLDPVQLWAHVSVAVQRTAMGLT